MFHALFEREIRHELVPTYAASQGKSLADAQRTIGSLTQAQIADCMVQARVKCGIDFPAEAYSPDPQGNAMPLEAEDATLFKGRIRAWLKAHPKFLPMVLSILLALLVVGT